MFATKLIVPVFSIALSGCGHLSFTNKDGTETGAKYYTPKPYLLVSQTGAKDKPIEVQVVFLPDLSSPTYVKPISGWGSSDLSVTFSNGMLVSFGQKTDPKIAELIGSIGGLTTSLATAQKTRADARAVEQALDIEDGNALIKLSDEIAETLKDNLATSLTGAERDFLTRTAAELRTLGEAIVAPGGAAPDAAALTTRLEGIVKTWDRQLRPSSVGPDAFKGYLERLHRLKDGINAVIAKSKPKQPDAPIMTLYEIDNSTTPAVLRQVPIATMIGGK